MRRPTLEAVVVATREEAAVVVATPEEPAVVATPEEEAGATSEEEATSRAAGTPWAVATRSADIWAAAVTLLPGTLPGLISPAAPARRPTTRPCMGVSRTPAPCTRSLTTRVAEASYPAGGAGTPGAGATGTAASGPAVISIPGLPGSCRYFRLVMPRSGGGGCPTTTGITSITPGAPPTTATS